MDTRTCNHCRETKPLSEFWRNRSGRDGFQRACKTCAEAAQLTAKLKPKQTDLPDGMKRCTTCKAVKAVEDFPRNRRYYDGRHHCCKNCHNGRYRTYRSNPENRAKIEIQRKKNFSDRKTKDKHYDQRTRKKYGLPKDWTYAVMLEAQGRVCAICERPDNPGMFRFAVDHDETTGIVRGLLCTCCNQALGQMRDSPDLLRKAAAYLEKPPAQQV